MSKHKLVISGNFKDNRVMIVNVKVTELQNYPLDQVPGRIEAQRGPWCMLCVHVSVSSPQDSQPKHFLPYPPPPIRLLGLFIHPLTSTSQPLTIPKIYSYSRHSSSSKSKVAEIPNATKSPPGESPDPLPSIQQKEKETVIGKSLHNRGIGWE